MSQFISDHEPLYCQPRDGDKADEGRLGALRQGCAA